MQSARATGMRSLWTLGGNIIAKLTDPHATGIAVADLDIAEMKAIRERIPINEHRALGRKCIMSLPG